MALLQTVILFCPFSCPTKGGFYGFDVLHERTECSDERFLHFIRSSSPAGYSSSEPSANQVAWVALRGTLRGASASILLHARVIARGERP